MRSKASDHRFPCRPPHFQLILMSPWERYDCSSLKVIAMMGTSFREQLIEGVWGTIPKSPTPSGLRSNRDLSSSDVDSLEGCSRKMASAGKAAPKAELKIINQKEKKLKWARWGKIIARGPPNHEGIFQRSPGPRPKKIKDDGIIPEI